MSKLQISRILMFAGVLLVIISITADWIGLGARPGFGLKQIIGTAAGLAALVYGYWFGFIKGKGNK